MLLNYLTTFKPQPLTRELPGNIISGIRCEQGSDWGQDLDWGEAIRIAVIGFVGVCIILALLALVIRLSGIVIGKVGTRTKNTGENKSDVEKGKE
jgi:hypothetical protein